MVDLLVCDKMYEWMYIGGLCVKWRWGCMYRPGMYGWMYLCMYWCRGICGMGEMWGWMAEWICGVRSPSVHGGNDEVCT